MIGGAISAKVEELIDPTRLMNRSSFGIAAASATKTHEIKILEYSFQFTIDIIILAVSLIFSSFINLHVKRTIEYRRTNSAVNCHCSETRTFNGGNSSSIGT